MDDGIPLSSGPLVRPDWHRNGRYLPRIEDWQSTEPSQPWNNPPTRATPKPRDRSAPSSRSYAPGEERGRKGWNPPRQELDELSIGKRVYSWHGKSRNPYPKVMAEHYGWPVGKEVHRGLLEDRTKQGAVHQSEQPTEYSFATGLSTDLRAGPSRRSSVTTIRPNTSKIAPPFERQSLPADVSLFPHDVTEELDALHLWRRRGWEKGGWQWQLVFEGRARTKPAYRQSIQTISTSHSYASSHDLDSQGSSFSEGETDESLHHSSSTPPSSDDALLSPSPSPSPFSLCTRLPFTAKELLSVPVPLAECPLRIEAAPDCVEKSQDKHQIVKEMEVFEAPRQSDSGSIFARMRSASDASFWRFGQSTIPSSAEANVPTESQSSSASRNVQEPRLRDAMTSLRDAVDFEAKRARSASPSPSPSPSPKWSAASRPVPSPKEKKKGWRKSLSNLVDLSARLGAAYVDTVSNATNDTYTAPESERTVPVAPSSAPLPFPSQPNTPFMSSSIRFLTLSTPIVYTRQHSIGIELCPAGYRASWEEVFSVFPTTFHHPVQGEEEGTLMVDANQLSIAAVKQKKPALPPKNPRRQRDAAQDVPQPASQEQSLSHHDLSATSKPETQGEVGVPVPQTAPSSVQPAAPLPRQHTKRPQRPRPPPGRPIPRDSSMSPVTTLRPIMNPLYLRVNALINTMYKYQIPWQGYGNGYAQSGDKVWGRKVWWPPKDGSEAQPATSGDGNVVMKSAPPEPSKLRYERYEWEWMWGLWREEELKRMELEKKRKNLLELREFLSDTESDDGEKPFTSFSALANPVNSKTIPASRPRKKTLTKPPLLSMKLGNKAHS